MGIFCNGNDWVTSATNLIRPSTDHTVSLWARLDDSGSTRRPFGNTGGWEMRTSGTTLISDLLQSGTLGSATLTVGTYHHLMIVQDVSNAERFFYVDGVLVDSILSASFAGQQTGLMNIAVAPGGGTQGWFGALDDLRIYDRIFGLEEAKTLHACRGTDGIHENLVNWWPMNEGAEGSTVAILNDIMGGINCTTVNNTPVYNYDAGIRQRRVA